MTKLELEDAIKLAIVRKGCGFVPLDIFDGFALPGFDPITCTMTQLADLIRWQCGRIFADGWDDTMLSEIMECGRRKFNVINDIAGEKEPTNVVY